MEVALIIELANIAIAIPLEFSFVSFASLVLSLENVCLRGLFDFAVQEATLQYASEVEVWTGISYLAI
jgi:hypothetical protein